MKLIGLAVWLALTVSAQSYRVAGFIVDDQSGSPLGRMRMVLVDGQKHEIAYVTTADGQFSFDVAEGKYSLYAERRGWRMTYGALTSSSTVASSVFTGPEKDTTHLLFRWFAPGAIFGKVIDERGEPVENATVQLVRQRILAGAKHTVTAAYGQTNDLGEFRFAPVAGGTYYLSVTGAPWFQNRSFRFGVSENNEPKPPELVFVPAFYPNASAPESAAPIVLKPGMEIEANFALRTVNAASVHATCEGCNGSVGLYFQGPGGVELFRTWVMVQQTTKEHHVPVMMGTAVPPGRYMARFSSAGKSMNKPIEIGASDVTIEVTPKIAPSVGGKVTFPNQMAPHATVYVRLVNENTGAVLSRVIERDGTFSWNSVAAGRYRPVVAGGGLFLSDVSAAGASLDEGVLEVQDGDKIRLNLVASDAAGRLKGFVMKDGKPLPGALAVLAPKDLRKDPGAYRAFQTDSDGSFDLEAVRAGDYYLFAADAPEFEYKNPAVLRPCLGGARLFHIDAATVYNENLQLSAPAQPAVR